MSTILMKCGHTAQGYMGGDLPVCVICWPSPDSLAPAEKQPLLEGRQAKCASCGHTAQSSYSLAFFKYRGEGSHDALHHCKNCMYYESAHNMPGRPFAKCKDFEPHGPYEYDEYYCGCRGWD